MAGESFAMKRKMLLVNQERAAHTIRARGT
jgi:hypothetical protein